MNVEAGAVVTLGSSGIVIYGDRYRGPGEYHFRDYNWSDMADVRADDTPREASDGDFPSRPTLAAFDFEIVGFTVAKSHGLLVQAMNRLKAQRSRADRVQVEEPALTSWANVEVRAVEWDEHGFAPEADFRLTLHMPDPRRYGPSMKIFASGELLSHKGDYDAIPEVTVTGTMPLGYTIVGPGGKQYTVSQPLAAGQTHRIDFRTGWLYLNDVLQRGAVTRAQTWTIPPGRGHGSKMTLVPVTGAGTLAIRVPRTSS